MTLVISTCMCIPSSYSSHPVSLCRAVSQILAANGDPALLSSESKTPADIARLHAHTHIQLLMEGVTSEHVAQAELAAKFVAARLLDKVRTLKKEAAKAHALPSVVSWAPPQVAIRAGWAGSMRANGREMVAEQEAAGMSAGVKEEKKADAPSSKKSKLSSKSSKSSPRKGGGKKSSKGKGQSEKCSSEKEGAAAAGAAQMACGAKKFWADGEIPTPFGVRRWLHDLNLCSYLRAISTTDLAPLSLSLSLSLSR